jgi:hypothetical protein
METSNKVGYGIITTDQLRVMTGYERTGDIEECLRKNGVSFL